MNDHEILLTLKHIEELLETLVRFNYTHLKKEAFTNPIEEKIFSSTGVKSREEIRNDLKISPNTLSDLWSKWVDLGLLVKDGNTYKKTV